MWKNTKLKDLELSFRKRRKENNNNREEAVKKVDQLDLYGVIEVTKILLSITTIAMASIHDLIVAIIAALSLIGSIALCYFCFRFYSELNSFAASSISDSRQQRRHVEPVVPSSDIEAVAPSVSHLGEDLSPTISSSKTEQLLYKFKFHTVTPNQSNFSAASIRAPDDMCISSTADNDEATYNVDDFVVEDSDNDDDDGSVIHAQQQQNSNWSLTKILSTWRKPSKDDSCCICLEAYRPGETICAATTPGCDHVFHQECIFKWLQSDHDAHEQLHSPRLLTIASATWKGILRVITVTASNSGPIEIGSMLHGKLTKEFPNVDLGTTKEPLSDNGRISICGFGSDEREHLKRQSNSGLSDMIRYVMFRIN
eukprot:scaffold158_cov105-Cylindrotheca_fusiformis.AAC.2